MIIFTKSNHGEPNNSGLFGRYQHMSTDCVVGWRVYWISCSHHLRKGLVSPFLRPFRAHEITIAPIALSYIWIRTVFAIPLYLMSDNGQTTENEPLSIPQQCMNIVQDYGKDLFTKVTAIKSILAIFDKSMANRAVQEHQADTVIGTYLVMLDQHNNT